MKKMICFMLVCLFSTSAYAKPFPTLKNYVVNGIVIGKDMSFEEVQKRLGKPIRSKKVRDECAELTYTYNYYPTVTFKDERVDEIFFSNPKNQLQLSTMTIDAKTTVESVKKLGKVFVSKANGITTFRLEGSELDAWIFDFKGGQLYRASFFSNDC